MPRVFIPPNARSQTGNRQEIEVPGRTVREAIENLERIHPGIKACLCEGDESLVSGLNVVVDNSISSLGLLQPVEETSEIHFLPSLGGG